MTISMNEKQKDLCAIYKFLVDSLANLGPYSIDGGVDELNDGMKLVREFGKKHYDIDCEAVADADKERAEWQEELTRRRGGLTRDEWVEAREKKYVDKGWDKGFAFHKARSDYGEEIGESTYMAI